MSEENQSQSSQLGFNFVIFILAIVVVANTDKDEWHALDYQTYYNFMILTLFASCMAIFTICITGSGAVYSEHTFGKICMTLGVVLSFLVLLVFYLFICMIWHHDPNHTILFYKEFWSEFSFKVSVDKKVYYYIGDVLIRIYSTALLILLFIIPCILCIACAEMKHKGTRTTPSIV